MFCYSFGVNTTTVGRPKTANSLLLIIGVPTVVLISHEFVRNADELELEIIPAPTLARTSAIKSSVTDNLSLSAVDPAITPFLMMSPSQMSVTLRA